MNQIIQTFDCEVLNLTVSVALSTFTVRVWTPIRVLVTRQVEYQFAYNQREDAGFLMTRAARNHGSAVALGFAGHSTAVTEIDGSISTGRMESIVMSSGLDDARMGFSSQGGDVPNIRRAQDIIKANKAGGNDDRNSDEVGGRSSISLSDSFRSRPSQIRFAPEVVKPFSVPSAPSIGHSGLRNILAANQEYPVADISNINSRPTGV